MSENVKITTDANFENDVLHSKIPVLVDFWAEWCQPCRSLAPIIDEIAEIYSGRINVFKINVDDNNEIPAKYNVRGIPTLLLFKNRDVVSTQVGTLTKSKLQSIIDETLG